MSYVFVASDVPPVYGTTACLSPQITASETINITVGFVTRISESRILFRRTKHDNAGRSK